VKFYLNYRTFYWFRTLCENVVFLAVQFFCDTLHQVATVVMETVQLVLSQFKNTVYIYEQSSRVWLG